MSIAKINIIVGDNCGKKSVAIGVDGEAVLVKSDLERYYFVNSSSLTIVNGDNSFVIQNITEASGQKLINYIECQLH